MDKHWSQSKKFMALVIVLAVILLLGILGIIFHEQVSGLITKIVAFASTHQLAQGTQDAIAKYKGTAGDAVQKAKDFFKDDNSVQVAEPSTVTSEGQVSDAGRTTGSNPVTEVYFNEEDRYANR